MAENSKIEWTTHTFNPCVSDRWLWVSPEASLVRKGMAPYAKGDSVPHIKAQFGIFGERSAVVRVEIAALLVPTVRASESVSGIDLVSPALKLARMAKAAPLHAFAIDVPWRISATRRSLARYFADLGACFWRVLFAETITWPCPRRCTHLRAALFRHALALHRRDEGCSSFQPALFGGFASGQISHG